MTSSGGKSRGHKQNCKHSDTQRTEAEGRILGLESAKLGSLAPPLSLTRYPATSHRKESCWSSGYKRSPEKTEGEGP